jgi:hypothetical protein
VVSAGRALDVLSALDAGGTVYVLLEVGRVAGDDLVVTASRGERTAGSWGRRERVPVHCLRQ